ncbi:unnamed protein product [Auanema sp. JU1783]|nr:unnamed protein product [Auanema sp. JU1783]
MDRSAANSTTNLTMRNNLSICDITLKTFKEFFSLLLLVEVGISLVVSTRLSQELTKSVFLFLLVVYFLSVVFALYGLFTHQTIAFIPIRAIWFLTTIISCFIFGHTAFTQLQCHFTEHPTTRRRCELSKNNRYWDYLITLLICGLKFSQIFVSKHMIHLMKQLNEPNMEDIHPSPDTDDEDMIVFERKISPNGPKGKETNNPIA